MLNISGFEGGKKDKNFPLKAGLEAKIWTKSSPLAKD